MPWGGGKGGGKKKEKNCNNKNEYLAKIKYVSLKHVLLEQANILAHQEKQSLHFLCLLHIYKLTRLFFVFATFGSSGPSLVW